MKQLTNLKQLSLLFLAFIFSISLLAQDAKIEITPTAGYTFSSRNNWVYADMDLRDNYSAGLALNVRIQQDILLELMYHNVTTDLNTTVYNGLFGSEYYKTPLAVEYYHIGGIREFSSEKLRPFTSFTLGGTRFRPTGETTVTSDGGGSSLDVKNVDTWAFSVSLGGGAKIMFSNRIGLRLQGRLMLPLYFNGVGIYCGSGCGGGASFGVYFVQLDLSAGIVIALGSY